MCSLYMRMNVCAYPCVFVCVYVVVCLFFDGNGCYLVASNIFSDTPDNPSERLFGLIVSRVINKLTISLTDIDGFIRITIHVLTGN